MWIIMYLKLSRDVELATVALWNMKATTDHNISFTGKNLQLRYAF